MTLETDTHTTGALAREESAPLEASAHAPASPAPAGSGAGLHLVRGRTMREALLDARRSLGARSIVIDHVTRPGTAGAPGHVLLAVSTVVPRSTDALAQLKERARALLSTGAAAAAGPEVKGKSGAKRPARSPLADVERRLREHGASKALRERVLEGIVAAEDEDSHPLDLAAVEVGKAFGVAHLPFQAGELCVLALLGPNGAGKTTTLAKLGSRLARAGRRVAIATLDVDRVGAVEQLEAFGRQLGVAAIALRDVDRFAAALLRDSSYDVILIDGSGNVARDAETVAALRARLDGSAGGAIDELVERAPSRARVEVLATLPASASRAVLDAVVESTGPLEPIGAVVTKIDETSEPLPALELSAAAGLDLAFFTNGPDLSEHFVRASAERFADIALTGRSLTVPSLGRPAENAGGAR